MCQYGAEYTLFCPASTMPSKKGGRHCVKEFRICRISGDLSSSIGACFAATQRTGHRPRYTSGTIVNSLFAAGVRSVNIRAADAGAR